MKLSYHDKALVAEHVGRLRDLAATHRQFAETADHRSDCAQTKAGAQAAATKAERLATIIETLTRPDGGERDG